MGTGTLHKPGRTLSTGGSGWGEVVVVDTPEFTDALDRLVERTRAHTVAFMCAETLWWKCHRRLIADALFVCGLDVRHILKSDDVRPHEPPPFLVVEGERLLYPAAESP